MIIPKKYQTDVISLLHDGHPGMSKMKSLARLHVWWPSIDKHIENHVQSCQDGPNFLYTLQILHPSQGNVYTLTSVVRLKRKCG